MVQVHKPRLDYLDALRAIAAIAVVVEHVFLMPLTDPRNSFFLHEVLDFGKFGVVIFFMISGMVIPFSLRHAGGDIRKFVIVRFFRLYPAYWLSMAVMLFVLYSFHLPMPSWRQVAANTTMVQALMGQQDLIGVYWTLIIELIFYGLCASASAVGMLRKPAFLEFASIGSMVVCMVLGIARFMLDKKLPVALPAGLAVMFLGAVWRFATVEGDLQAKRAVKRIIAATIVLLPTAFYFAYRRDMGNDEVWSRYVFTYVIAIGGTMICTSYFKLRAVWLVKLGAVSYSLYLFHAPIDLAVVTLIGTENLAVSLLASAIAIAFSFASYNLVERRFNLWGRRLSAERAVAVARR